MTEHSHSQPNLSADRLEKGAEKCIDLNEQYITLLGGLPRIHSKQRRHICTGLRDPLDCKVVRKPDKLCLFILSKGLQLLAYDVVGLIDAVKLSPQHTINAMR